MLLPSLGHEVKFDNSKVILAILHVVNVQWKVEMSEIWRTFHVTILETRKLSKCTFTPLHNFTSFGTNFRI